MRLPSWINRCKKRAGNAPSTRGRQPARTRLVLEKLEDRIVPDSKTFAGLEFSASNAFAVNGTQDSVSGLVQVGLAPAQGASFTPLLALKGGVQFNTTDATGSFTATGPVDAIIGGLDIPLLGSGNCTLPGKALATAAGFSVPASLANSVQNVSVAGVSFALSDIALTSSGINLQGAITVPGLAGLSVAVNGSNHVSIGTSGVTLTGVDASITKPETLSIAGLSLTLNSLDVQYTSSSETFQISGSGSLALLGKTVNITLGTAANPGLVIENGSVSSFNLSASTADTISVGAATVALSSLDVSYTKSTDTVAVSGSGTLSVGSIVKNATINLGSNNTAGIVISGGKLQSFDGSISASSISIAGLTFTNVSLEADYQASTQDLAISGGATFTVPGTSSSVSVTLGATKTPGIEITKGTLSQFNFSISSTSSISIAGVTIDPQSLAVSYVQKTAIQTTKTLDISGSATFSVGSVIQNANITLGNSKTNTPGIVITNGTLKSIDASVTGSINVAGATITATDLTVEYAKGNFEIYGSAGFAFASQSLTATLGTQSNPGLVVHKGSLQNLNIGVTGSFDLFGLTVSAKNLTVQYDAQNSDLEFSGGVGVSLTGLFTFDVALTQGGLVINTKTGDLSVNTSTGLGVSTTVGLGPFSTSLDFNYSNNSLTASGQVAFPDFSIGGSFSFANNQLTGVSFDYSGPGIAIGDTGLFLSAVSGSLQNLNSPSDIVFSGSVTVTAGESVTIGSSSYALLSMKGTVTVSAKQFDLNGTVSMLGGYLGSGSADLNLNWATGVYQISGTESWYDDLFSLTETLTITPATGMIALEATASVNVPQGLPSFVYQFLGVNADQSLGSANLYMQIDLAQNAPLSDTYVMVWINLPGGLLQAGFQLTLGGNPFTISGYASGTLARLADEAIQGVETAAVAAWRGLGQTADEIGNDIQTGFYDLGQETDAVEQEIGRDVTSVMHTVGYKTAKIVDVLEKDFTLTGEEFASFLHSLNAGAIYVGKILDSYYKTAAKDVYGVLTDAGYLATDAVTVLSKVYDQSEEAIAGFLVAAGQSIEDIGSDLKDALGAAANDVLVVTNSAVQGFLNGLKDLGSAQALIVTLVEVELPSEFAGMLQNVYDYSSQQIATAFKTALHYADNITESALQAIGEAESDVVNSVSQAYGVAASTITNLWNQGVKEAETLGSEIVYYLDPFNW